VTVIVIIIMLKQFLSSFCSRANKKTAMKATIKFA